MSGKWDDPRVPKSGWVCVDVEDMEGDRAVCEMCEYQSIRWVHTMVHSSWGNLRTGCECAGHMEHDVEAARKRERAAKNRATRRARFADLKKWHQSIKSGNWTLRHGLFRLVVFPNPSGEAGWKVCVIEGQKTQFGRKVFPTLREAQQGCFDALEWATR